MKSKRSKNSNSEKSMEASSTGGLVGTIDLNCDMGECMENDEAIMPYISSANIACGYHAGNADLIWETIELTQKHDVSIGAHPSFLDKENFGRREIDLSPGEIYSLTTIRVFVQIDGRLSQPFVQIQQYGFQNAG